MEPVQVIAVPKISSDSHPIALCGTVDTQMVELLVEVPTEPGYALAVLASKFYSRREVRGFLSGHGSTASGAERSLLIFQFLMVGGGVAEVFKVFFPAQSPTAAERGADR